MSYAYIKLLSIMIHSADIKNKKILKLLLHDYAKTIIKKKEIIFLYILLNSYREKTDVFDKPLYKFIDKYIDKYSVQLCKKFILI
tara:strand:- start:2434 stop:2688 length:255 start_codon:yes stop_codon:yes gene_type:complete